MKGQAIRYSEAELAWIKANRHLPRRELHTRFAEKFGRADLTKDQLTSLCKRKGWLTGRTGQFEPGQVSHNKGKKGLHYPGMEKGWFKPGERRGVAHSLYKPIGTERVTREGYIERKINDDLPLQARWRAVHVIRWEEVHGPVPEGHALKCLDGDKSNTDPSNWECLPRAIMLRLNSREYDRAPQGLRPTILNASRLEHVARERRKGSSAATARGTSGDDR